METGSLKNSSLAFVGCGVMAESIIAGLLRQKIVEPQQISASHPRSERRDFLSERYGIKVCESNTECVSIPGASHSLVVLCVKPQRIARILKELSGAVRPNQLVISIVAGARIEAISEALNNPLVVRAMPNTPAQIGAGMTVWTCSAETDETHRGQVARLFGALGKQLHVETENMIDMATSLSATGPTYIFMMMEALTDAGVHMGFSREVSKELVQQTMLGSTLFAIDSHKHPAELRNMVTSPGGTSAAAIYEMEKGGLRTVFSKAVYAAYKRAQDLGK
jgi:pyrroline-5-carboxylate reductase